MLCGNVVVSMVVVLLAVTGFGCDWLDDQGLPPWPKSSPKAAPDAAAPVAATDGGSAPDSDGHSGSYDAMCLHYCQALEETDVLVCASSGRDANTCAATTASTTSDCVALRCQPQLVDLALCLTQCDSLARAYAARCPAAAAPSDALCPSSQADHDAACRAGCVL